MARNPTTRDLRRTASERYAVGKSSRHPYEADLAVTRTLAEARDEAKYWSTQIPVVYLWDLKTGRMHSSWRAGKQKMVKQKVTSNPRGSSGMTDRVSITETYKTGKGVGVIVSESGKMRGPYVITAVVGDRGPKRSKAQRLLEARAKLRSKLGPLRKAQNPDEVLGCCGVGGGGRNPVHRKTRGDRYTVTDYMNEVVMYGGEPTTRGEVIKDLQARGFEQALIDRYLQGLDRASTTQSAKRNTIGASGSRRGERNPLNKYYFQRGANGPLIRRKGKPYWVGSLEVARDKARELSKRGKGAKVVVLRVEPDGDKKVVGSAGNPRRNPSASMADADRLYEDFHGRPPTQTTRVLTKTRMRTDYTELGPLTELKVHLLTGKRKKLPFATDCAEQIMLCSSPDGQQLYFIGGDQTIDLGALDMDGREWVKDSMVLGVLEMVTYRTEKGFDHFKLTDYYHELGEESGMQPLLIYDNINGLLSVAGGQYEVRPEGIVN